MNESARYTFGTSPAAAERLRSIGDFFNPIADMHIRRFVKTRPEVAIDLGCRPDHMETEKTYKNFLVLTEFVVNVSGHP